jgi:hypothetical protein
MDFQPNSSDGKVILHTNYIWIIDSITNCILLFNKWGDGGNRVSKAFAWCSDFWGLIPQLMVIFISKMKVAM